MSASRQQGDDDGDPLSSSEEHPVCSSIANDRLRNATSNVLLGLANDMLQSSTPHHQTGSAGVPAAPPLDQESSAASRTSHRHQPPARGMMYLPIKPSTTRSALVPERRTATTKRSSDQDYKPNGAGGRKKTKKCSDKRWTKRFTWPEELHREFVSAIFDVGMKNASPSTVMEFMRPNPELTSERVKSHLQKYRLNRVKSRKEFLESFDTQLSNLSSKYGAVGDSEASQLSCGGPAAYCMHETMHGQDVGGDENSFCAPQQPSASVTSISDSRGEVSALTLPLLTADEREGPLGQSFSHLIGMFNALSEQLEMSRHRQQTPIQASEPRPPQRQAEPKHQPCQPTVEQTAAQAATLHVEDPCIEAVAAQVAATTQSFIPTEPSTHEQQEMHAPGVALPMPTSVTYQPASRQQQIPAPALPIQEIPNISRSPIQTTSSSERRVAHVYAREPSKRPLQRPDFAPRVNQGQTLQAQQDATDMRKEMQGLGTFQTRMRAMKNQELNKCRSASAPTGRPHSDSTFGGEDHAGPPPNNATQHPVDQSISTGVDIPTDFDFWNTENDDTIFSFLMAD
ncbi:hypothetical protein THAOC_02259 [Thalassiosira oceanica]|uniref:HTH myb-type domain-containing protein n=1 Tax=Thalassiosira oceanica TaxID=159749 RepID=K0TB42_THAOC|nr:hypothetical protein THAOC_02259 [Thalassiosira oceanica]|eukprot:EJK75998.1 hypothetical protein THAOC_02259 [Thalassiosira oceanica]